jgi:hypothetical protein
MRRAAARPVRTVSRSGGAAQKRCTVIFVAFVRILIGVAVVWLLFRLLFPHGVRGRAARERGRNPHRRPYRKFVPSSVVDKEDQTDGKTKP